MNKLAIMLICGVTIGLASASAYGQQSSPDGPRENLKSTGQAYLGLGVAPIPAALSSQLADVIGEDKGVLVVEVARGSPAEKAGLQPHDIVIGFDQQKVYSPEQLVKLVRNKEPGKEAAISYVRAGKLHNATVALAEAPARDATRGRSASRMPLLDRFVRRAAQDGNPEDASGSPEQAWVAFKQMTISKLDDNRYRAEIDYQDKDHKPLHRKYEGTRDEIRKAIEADKDLPADERDHLLRSLDQQAPDQALIEQINRELYNWPNLDF